MNKREFLKFLGMTPLAIVFPNLLTHVTAEKTVSVVKNLKRVSTTQTTSTSSSSSTTTDKGRLNKRRKNLFGLYWSP